MKDDSKRELRPKLRFPEFRDAGNWEEKKLGELLLIPPAYGVNAAGVPYSEHLPTYLRITDISDDGLFLVDNKVSVNIDADAEMYLEKGDIVLARTGASVGKSYRYRETDGPLVFAGFLIRIRPDSTKINPTLLSNFVSTRKYWDWVRATSTRSGQPGINGNEYASLPVPVPAINNGKGLLEQQKIADCLSSLDDLITAEAQKLYALKSHKNGLLQQLFPVQGETVPRLRFPEFRQAEEWTLATLGRFAEVVASGDLDLTYFSPSVTHEHVYPVYSNAVEKEGIYGYYSIPKYPKNSVTITARGTLGIAFLRRHAFVGIGRLVVVTNLKELDPFFLKECWNHSAAIPREVTSIPQLTAITARSTLLPMPCLAEQQIIADCISSLDDLITAQVRKIELLKNHKRGLMQQLFPSVEESL